MLSAVTVFSGAAGGAATAAVFGALGVAVPESPRLAIGTLLALLLLILSVISPHRLPQLNRETRQRLLEQGPIRWASINGFLLGTGLSSRIGYWLFYAVPVGCFVLASPSVAAGIGAEYGLVRLGIASYLGMWMHLHPDRMSQLSRALLSQRETTRRLSQGVGTLITAALALAVGL